MAKKKKPDIESWKAKPIVLQIRGSAEWKAWIAALAEHEGDTAAKLAERALREFARRVGFRDPPRR